MRVLVTGGSGFVGKALVKTLKDGANLAVRTSSRRASNDIHKLEEEVFIADLSTETDWSDALLDVQVVVHTAARVHVINRKNLDQLKEFRIVNVEGTANLARQAAAARVRRFIFLSSIKVNGDMTELGVPFKVIDTPAPEDPYGISKMEAEQVLRHISKETGMELVIIRPPLVYGPNAKGNFASMVKWLKRGFPLPFGSINNKRSFVGLDNLCDLISRCIDHPSATGKTFMVSDDEDLSTTDLLKRSAFAMGINPRLVNIPQILIEYGAYFFGKADLAQRLCGSLQVDISKTKEILNWKPPISVDEGLNRAVS
jgi:nucleoside-diphosphate-sugar epimerase